MFYSSSCSKKTIVGGGDVSVVVQSGYNCVTIVFGEHSVSNTLEHAVYTVLDTI